MARITANVGERILNITNWRGVNEAPEGEARLKLGEAAVMRNFCVTSGGALKKRPGSRNVAGLLDGYVVKTSEERRCLYTDRGLAERQLWPRAVADKLGKAQLSGDPVEVENTKAASYEGYFVAAEGEVWALDECEVTKAAGTEDISGGMGTLRALTRFASGTVTESESGRTVGGTQTVQVWPDASIRGGELGTVGSPVTYPNAHFDGTGFATRDVGGFFLKDGRLWKYYGAKMESVDLSHKWREYGVEITPQVHWTYTRTGFKSVRQFDALSVYGTFTVGNTSYSYDSENGIFTLTGERRKLIAGDSGIVYDVSEDGRALGKIEYVRVTGSQSAGFESRDEVVGTSTTTYDYAVGEPLGTVMVKDGAMPGADAGYEYFRDLESENTVYTLMRRGGDFRAYCRDPEDKKTYGTYSHSWYGYPLTVGENVYEWYFKKTYCEAETVSDRAVRGIWSGFVGGREVLCAACGGHLWELDLEGEDSWIKTAAGSMDTSRDVHMFGFEEKLYILNGRSYYVWDGERLREVEGYRPLVSVSVEPAGGGTLLENVNRLSAGRRCWISPDGEAVTFQLPETDIASVDWVKDLRTGQELSGTVSDPDLGTVTFQTPPARGVNSIEIAWSSREDLREQVCAMRFAEIYNGAQDTRVFLYGDGSNKAIYSGIDYDGRPRADYFPDLYEVAVGDANTPITAMIRHYNKLMAFKSDSAWSIGYDTITLIDGTVTAGFYVSPVNRSIGNCALGQAELVQNRPRTLDGRSVIEWRATSSGGITGDQRNAERVSQRVDNSIRQFDLSKARTFYDKFSHEYYVIGEDGTAIVQNLDVDAWYVYTGLHVTCMINYRDELYYGTADGYLRHFSDRYFSDDGEAIDALWESGAMSFSEDFRRKYSAMVWIGIKPEDNGYLEVTAQTDRKSDFAVYDVTGAGDGGVPEMERIKLKAKKFTYYKLILRNNTSDRTCTVVSADMRVRGTGYVR